MQLFAGPDVGLENNGDGYRLWCQLSRLPPPWSDVVWQPPLRYSPCSLNPDFNAAAYPTSAILLLGATYLLNQPFIDTAAALDMRFLGIISALLLGGIAALGIYKLPGPLSLRLALVITTCVLWLDIGLLSYLNSYYAEPMGFISSALLLVMIGYYAALDRPSWRITTLLFIVIILTITAKTQLIVLLLPIVCLLLVLPVLRPQPSWPRCWLQPLTVLLGLSLVIGLYFSSTGHTYGEINRYNTIFKGILVESTDPAEDLATLGLPPSLAPYAGTGFWPARRSAVNHPDYPTFAADASRGRILLFLAQRPSTYLAMLKRTLQAMPNFRVYYLSNFEGTHRLASRPEPMTVILTGLAFLLWPLLPLGLLLAIGVGLWQMWRHRHSAVHRAGWTVLWFQASAVLLSVMVIPVGDGYYELHKHTTLVVWQLAPLLAAALVFGVRAVGNMFIFKTSKTAK